MTPPNEPDTPFTIGSMYAPRAAAPWLDPSSLALAGANRRSAFAYALCAPVGACADIARVVAARAVRRSSIARANQWRNNGESMPHR